MFETNNALELLEFDDNPRQASSNFDPRDDAVTVNVRPESYFQLLTESRFARPGWHSYAAQKGDAFFYVEDLAIPMQLFSVTSLRFLKDRGYVDQARELDILREGGAYSRMSGVKLFNNLSPTRVGAAAPNIPLHFHVAVTVIVALELAIREEIPEMSPFWPYEYLRIRPAIYSIRQFTTKKLCTLRAKIENFDDRATAACHQHSSDFLDELAGGYPVTFRTAKLLKNFIDSIARSDDLAVQGVVYELQRGMHKPKHPCASEIL